MDHSAIRIRWILICFLSLGTRYGLSAEWVWGPRSQAEFRIEMAVEIPPESQSVKLKAAVDSCSLTVQWNQREWQLETAARLAELDLTESMTDGPQHFHFAASSHGGPAAIAFEIIAISVTGETTVLVESSQSLASSTALEGADKKEVHEYGRVEDEPWWNIRRKPRVSAFDEYNQWKEANQVDRARQAASFQLPDDFQRRWRMP